MTKCKNACNACRYRLDETFGMIYNRITFMDNRKLYDLHETAKAVFYNE
jgi:hypothetical protein